MAQSFCHMAGKRFKEKHNQSIIQQNLTDKMDNEIYQIPMKWLANDMINEYIPKQFGFTLTPASA